MPAPSPMRVGPLYSGRRPFLPTCLQTSGNRSDAGGADGLWFDGCRPGRIGAARRGVKRTDASRSVVDGPAPDLSCVSLVPEGHGLFAQFPAQVNFSTVPHRREIHTAALVIADFAPDGCELAEQIRQPPGCFHAAGLDDLQLIQPSMTGQPCMQGYLFTNAGLSFTIGGWARSLTL